jgi:hypothetical protein
MDPLVHSHIMLGAEQRQRLRAWAADRDTSMAVLVREAIDYYLRVAMGPAPERVRRAARNTVGVLPPAGDVSGESPDASAPGPWWWGEA